MNTKKKHFTIGNMNTNLKVVKYPYLARFGLSFRKKNSFKIFKLYQKS